ncbi:IF factor, partial [Polypterus senegalus]
MWTKQLFTANAVEQFAAPPLEYHECMELRLAPSTSSAVPKSQKDLVTHLLSLMVQAEKGLNSNPSLLLGLRLAQQHNLPVEQSALTKLQQDAVSKVRGGLPFSSGNVALYCMAMQASCHNPSDIPASDLPGGKLNLVNVLEEKLVEEIFNIDTGSVAVLALTCLKQFKTIQAFPTLQSRIESTIRKLIAKIQQHKQENGIIGNLYSTGLAAQALIVNQVNFNCNKTIKTILAQVSSGAFDNPMTASQIVPFLGGYTYLNVSSLKCTADQNNLPLPAPTHTSPPSSSSISVQFTVANPFRNSSNSIDVSVLDGSTLLTVMERAAQLDPQHFRYWRLQAQEWRAPCGPFFDILADKQEETQTVFSVAALICR